MRKLIPFLNTPVAPPRQSTQKRFESVFASLTLLLQATSATYATRLAAWLGAVYNKVTTLLYGEPTVLKQQFHLWRTFYLHYLRSDYATALSQFPQDGTYRVEGYIRDLVDIREAYIAKLSPFYLQLFDSIVFAFLSFDRLMSFEVPPNYTTITDPAPEPPKDSEGSVNNIADHLAALGITPEAFKAEYKRRCREQKHIIFSTAGPNGPASWTAHTDASSIMADSGLYASFQAFAESSGMTRFVQDLLGTVSLPSYDVRPDHIVRSARLHSFEEWGGKTRTVAILDYWTQLILTPLHDTIFHFLEKIPSDGTFNQDAVAERVRQFTLLPDASIYSYDLTAATDRLPISLQERVLAILLGPALARSWAKLLVGREYHTSDGKALKYGAGQPMGAKSSWAMFTLTHHVIVQQAANSTGASPYFDYGMVGDDVSMVGSAIAEQYRKIMSYYGVSINMRKSLVPFAGALPAAELCKRVFINGMEISCIPVKLIAKTVSNGRLATQLQNHMTSRIAGWAEKALLLWIGGLVDKESLEFLTILNMLPKSVTGIDVPQVAPITEAQFSAWYPNTEVKVDSIIQAYTYVAIVEQLKRLDNLLRQTQIITAAIETNAFGYHVQQLGTLGWQYEDPNHPVSVIAASMPKFNATHPIVKASVAEVDRIGDLLASLRTGDKDLTTQARRRLLDMFRNALTDSWADADAARGQSERSLVQRALTTLTDICNFRPDVKDNRGNIITKGHHLSFTVMLAYLNRMWHVDWRLNSEVTLNAVKSRVAVSTAPVQTTIDTITQGLNLSTRFSPARKAQEKTQAPVAPISKTVNPHVGSLDPSN